MRRFGAGIGPVFALALWAGPAISGSAVTLAIRDATGQSVPAAVAYLEGTSRGPVTGPVTAVIDQRDKAFVPAVTVIRSGTRVRFPNSDSVSHHVYSFAQPNAFELPLYKGGARPEVQFDHPGVVTLGCNIHDAMLGYVVVVDTPYFVVAGQDGTAGFGDVASGSYEIRVWSPRLDPVQSLSGGRLDVRARNVTQPVELARRLRPEPVGGGSLQAEDY